MFNSPKGNNMKNPQTPAQKLGYKVGDIFEVSTRCAVTPVGTILKLFDDDGSSCPMFEVVELTDKNYSGYEVGDTYFESLDDIVGLNNCSVINSPKPTTLFNIHFTRQQAIDFIKKELQDKVSSFHSDFSVTISD